MSQISAQAKNTTTDSKALLQIKKRLDEIPPNTTAPDDTQVLQDSLLVLSDVHMTYDILRDTLIGKTVTKFKKHAVLGKLAQPLLAEWKLIVKKAEQEKPPQQNIHGAAAVALRKFRQRHQELETEGRKKPDMIAFKELRGRYTPRRRHGELEGVPVGVKLRGRGEAAILGIHQSILAGIDAEKDEPCYAVCLSGGYGDDMDQADGVVKYTGCGGQKGRRQVEDQEENVHNLSLLKSMATQTPIRLLRGTKDEQTKKPLYFYEGLYQCTDYEYTPSQDGPKVYIFTLVPIPGKSRSTIRVTHANPSTQFRWEGRVKNRILSSDARNKKRRKEQEVHHKRQRQNATKG